MRPAAILVSVGLIGAAGGCDQLFGLRLVNDPPPPPIDAPVESLLDAPANITGCSDATREGFGALSSYPDIAGCGGAWLVPGLRGGATTCNRMAGNTAPDPFGNGCAAEDLCAEGWHVCATQQDVFVSLPPGDKSCGGLDAAPSTFFATAQSGSGDAVCDAVGTNDFAGCGTWGVAAQVSCTPLDLFADNECFAIRSVGGWVCPDSNDEVNTVTKSGAFEGGGVLCCRTEL